MTIFDSIKYPIPDGLVGMSVFDLPQEIFDTWVHHPEFIHTTPKTFDTIRYPENVSLLRRVIAEYESKQ